MLRDWTQSEKIDQVSGDAERFFTRLIMKADDYGCFWGDIRLLKANLFPLKLDKIREADITRWIAECVKAGLILFYEVNQKRYVQIIDFRQRLDRAKAKFPLPPEATDFREVENEFPPEVEEKGSRSRKRSEKVEVPVGITHTPDEELLFKNFSDWIVKHAPRVAQMKKPITIDEYLTLRKTIPKDVITKLLNAMENRADLHKKYVSAYLTIVNWSKNEFNGSQPKTEQTGSSINDALKNAGKAPTSA